MKPFTKSRFKLGIECPNKLFFTSNPLYANSKNQDTFLKALAQGGFQVEELARLSFPNGIFINTPHHDYKQALDDTLKYIKEESCTLFEAAFSFEDLFVRTDIVEKNGNNVKLIEVKAKSFDPSDPYCFIGKKGAVVASWKPYLFDIAFQKYVAQKNFPELSFSAHLMMADKTKTAKIDGLNQMFRIPANGDPRTDIKKKVKSIEEIGETVLTCINVDDIIEKIINSEIRFDPTLTFAETINLFSTAYKNKDYLNWPASFSACKNCEFSASIEQKKNGFLDGKEFCFQKHFLWNSNDFEKPNAFEIWDFRGKNLIEENRLLMSQLSEEDFNIKVEPGRISASERKWIQVQKEVNKDKSIHIERSELKHEMSKWKFPLHFIDFETSAVALPFTANRKPYEQVAFQFSEHVYYEDGSIEHKSEYINAEPGVFPNFDFVRALKKSLDMDSGSVFRFADHENTILNEIIKQLNNSNEIDKIELIEFLKSITHSTKSSVESWQGDRDMIDLRKIILNYYYNPLTKGSNSIKDILPAAINSSKFIKEKYLKPIKEINLTSKNFAENHIWLLEKNASYQNPYKQLPSLFNNWSSEELENIMSDLDDIADGGAALTAYAKLQYVDMTEAERNELISSLLKYCELDTLAMVMIYEHLRFDF